ncbi:exonuclease domain-containing protein [Streptomyces sp. NPDC059783]|uniref:3'-5' exonuclease n=1 Tax=Streptomyces sp. NPDC059783 TaxID=3346944 RepID=UPI0036548718
MTTPTPAKAPRPLAFIDTETTGLDPHTHEIWEIAVIKRDPDGRDWESHFQIRKSDIHLAQTADEQALKIGRYHERIAVPADCGYAQIDGDGRPCAMSRDTLVYDLTRLLTGAMLVGSNPAFDAAFLRAFLGATPWHYRTVDIAAMAVGHLYGQAYTLTKQQCSAEYYARADALLADGWRSYELSRLMGIEPPSKSDAHTALGDARWARDVYDAITKADAFYTATDDQLAKMAGQALSTGGQQ